MKAKIFSRILVVLFITGMMISSCGPDKGKQDFTAKLEEVHANSVSLLDTTHMLTAQLQAFSDSLTTNQDYQRSRIINSINMISRTADEIDQWVKQYEQNKQKGFTPDQILKMKEDMVAVESNVQYLHALNASAKSLMTDRPETWGKWDKKK